MMTTGERPREIESKGTQGATDPKATAALTPELPPIGDEPFLDEIEMTDPRVREWREKMSRVHSSGWTRIPITTSKVEGVKTVGEILNKHPLIKKLLGGGNHE